MNIWLIILFTGLGTYLMRSTGVWMKNQMQAPWLNHIPFAVILVMAISGVADLSQTKQQTISAIASSIIVIVASILKLPLIFRIALGCIIFGTLSSTVSNFNS